MSIDDAMERLTVGTSPVPEWAASCGDQQGTYAGAQRHGRLGEKPCEPCRAAATAYARDWRLRTGKGRLVYFPTEDARGLVSDFDGLGAVIARSLRESA